MNTARERLLAHTREGLTTMCRCWAIGRKDGTVLGFTDHDCDVSFDDIVFKADTGLVASALVQSTGLSVDNTEAMGALSDPALSEEDIMAGRYDGADVRAWLVNWSDPDARIQLFRGTIGEVRRSAGAFRAELRGLTENLNQPQGRIYHKACSAVLGDGACAFDLNTPGFFVEAPVEAHRDRRVFSLPVPESFAKGWFERGMLRVMSGAGEGLSRVIKNDRSDGTFRQIEVWAPVAADVVSGDIVRLEAGCDKRAKTCRVKFDNFLNFRGFPHIPGEDWLTRYPVSSRPNTGGSLFDTFETDQ